MAQEMFGPYRLEERIGEGGMGEVFRAYDTVRGRAVALKRLPYQLAADPDFQKRFRKESSLVARLAEPHIIPIHDFGEIDGRLYIDMRLVNGSDLATLLSTRGPLSPEHAVEVITQTAAALDAAHADDLIHRDVKPSNLLVTGQDHPEFVYLADFGIARALSASTALTATGAAIGTLDYMAPERFAGGAVDQRIDVYSLACVLYETLTATKPFTAEGAPALMYAHVNGDIPRLSAHLPGIAHALDEVIARGMAKDPKERYSTAGALASAARAALAGDPPQQEPPAATISISPSPDRSSDLAATQEPRTETAPAAGAQEPAPAKESPTAAAGQTLALSVTQVPTIRSALPPTHPKPNRAVVLAGAAVIVLVASGIAITMSRTSDTFAGQSDPDFREFYIQKLQWRGCRDFALSREDQATFADRKFDCTYLQVPLDYSQPGGKTAQIAVLRQKASNPAQRIGSLLMNPGGPGGSGTQTAAGMTQSLTPELTARFDLVGFDPRGVQSSRPAVQCLTPTERDAERLDTPLDNSSDGVTRQESKTKEFVQKCEQRSGRDLLANIGTRDAVRDMDILRSALGDEKLTFLGFGSYLGVYYAEMFPRSVRAMVLDGIGDPNIRKIDNRSGFPLSESMQRSFNLFAAYCAKQTGCPLGQDPNQANAAFRRLVDPLQTAPITLTGGRKMSYNDAITGTVQALYSDQLWDPLRRGLVELANGQGRILMLLADLYKGRNDDGTYAFTLDALTAISCVDNEAVSDPKEIVEADRQHRAVVPFLDDGRGANPARDPCAFWPVPHTSEPNTLQVGGLPPVLVISSTDDPATPYQAGVNLAKALGARLLTAEANQHTVALQGNPCVDDYVTKYLIDPSQLPSDGARCKVAAQ